MSRRRLNALASASAQGQCSARGRRQFDAIPGLDTVRSAASLPARTDDEVAEDDQPPQKRAPRGRTTRANDPLLRAAIERRSLDVAKEHYMSLGAAGGDIKELGKPYDLVVQLAGVERHVEVKGSSMLIDAVELTINEVTHGQTCTAVDLVVVDGRTIVRVCFRPSSGHSDPLTDPPVRGYEGSGLAWGPIGF